MKNNNKLTLKALKTELEMLKAKKTTNSPIKPGVETHKSSVAHDIKNSYIQNLHMKSSMLYLWLITAALGYSRGDKVKHNIIKGESIVL